jgi:C4-dicarboxylate transporter DctM subunit
LFTETSIGQLFIAALVPAVIAVLFYFVAIGLAVRYTPNAAPSAVCEDRQEVSRALRRSVPVLLLFILVLGGLYTGIFTATESAAVGAFAAFFVALVRGRLGGGAFRRVMVETVQTTAFIYGLIFGALTFAFFMNVTGVPDALVGIVGNMDVAPLVIIAVLLVFYLALGCVMDSFGIMVITLPAVVPLIQDLGYSLIWWGIVMVIVIETGLITPPFGIDMFVLKSVVPDIPITTIYRGVVPFVLSDIVKLALVVVFPALALWLPSTMFN